MMTKKAVLYNVESQQVRFIDLWFLDILGVVKNVTVPAAQIEQVLERGLAFDGSSVDGFDRLVESDMVLMPDPTTFVILPWFKPEERAARMICQVQTIQGEPFLGDSRNILLRALAEAEGLGYQFKIGMEMEFFVFKSGVDGRVDLRLPLDEASYFEMTPAPAQSVQRQMILALQALGIGVHSAHSEIGSGQHEIDFDYHPALMSADHLVTARLALRTVAQSLGLHCTFMPRPRMDLPGSGMHTHQSLHDAKTGANVFYDANDEYGLSETARYFLAGQLHHARAMTAILAPLINSYKRLGTSFEAPVHISWAHVNRAALIRVPSVRPGMGEHTRLELRMPDPSANPYLAAAVMLHAGLDGIRRRLPLPEPIEETVLLSSRRRHIEALPASLDEALDALEQDTLIQNALGAYIAERYIEVRRKESEAYRHHITQWELDRYFNRY